MNYQNKPQTPKQKAEFKYMAARANLMLLILITAVDVVLVMVKSGMHMLYSLAATVPVYMAGIGDSMAQGASIGMGLVGLLLVIPYILCFVFSKKRYEWLIGALAYFVLDCVFLAVLALRTGTSPDIFEILIHIYFLYYLITGWIFGAKLRKMPEDDEEDMAEEEENEDALEATDEDLSEEEEAAAEEAEKAFWAENDHEQMETERLLRRDENKDLL